MKEEGQNLDPRSGIVGLNMRPELPEHLVAPVNRPGVRGMANQSAERAHADTHDKPRDVQQGKNHQQPQETAEEQEAGDDRHGLRPQFPAAVGD